MVCGGLPASSLVTHLSSQILVVVCGDVWWFWWFAVVCGGLRWFSVICGGLSFSHTLSDPVSQWQCQCSGVVFEWGCTVNSCSNFGRSGHFYLLLNSSREVKPKIVFGFRMLKPVSLVRS